MSTELEKKVARCEKEKNLSKSTHGAQLRVYDRKDLLHEICQSCDLADNHMWQYKET